MFDKILIANRGEIACRIIRTCRRMGVATVAVYSDADAGALHVRLADEAVRIGPPPVVDSYLKQDAILDAARRTGAQAVHPGYGFLSENAGFARACAQGGLVFVGPSPEAISAMGLKGAAKSLMNAAGVPVVPGYEGEQQDDDLLLRQACEIGWPLLIKAVAGGGGKGMRLAESREDFPSALQGARREALAAFGDDRVLLERYLPRARHIEVQVFGDTLGHVVHLFERDCSVQRRHQKVIEEAPAPGMPDDMRQAMTQAAVTAAKAIGYCGAGTIEFIADVADGLRADRFYFMEMNTRLQVEHPVTEAITGVDLVEWQLRVAAGEPLPLSQDGVSRTGHAVEARLYAEDPARGFLPSTGTLRRLSSPRSSRHVRVDTGVREGDAISAHYDPMIAKLIVRGASRPEALRRLGIALEDYEIAGPRTNRDFLRRIVGHPDFVTGGADTGFIPGLGEEFLFSTDGEEDALILATVHLLLERNARNAGNSPWDDASSWQNNLDVRETFSFQRDEESRQVIAVHSRGKTVLDLQSGQAVLGHVSGRDGRIEVEYAGRRLRGFVVRDANSLTVITRQSTLRFMLPDPAGQSGSDDEGLAGAVQTPMPGRVIAALVKTGDRVERNQPLLILEAMKMEHTVRAPSAGIVRGLALRAGDQVGEGAVLLSIEP